MTLRGCIGEDSMCLPFFPIYGMNATSFLTTIVKYDFVSKDQGKCSACYYNGMLFSGNNLIQNYCDLCGRMKGIFRAIYCIICEAFKNFEWTL